ncbi:hypothetical protein [Paenibacillus sp. OAS669]|uniref:hypothetical protein n=1 Tax=Paenibacillus sp. OAS669 TaxID=2663821 RepID=UPI00178A4CE5|nr:hypothetical protein [Paenibacillus sp. OAS669]MBE1444879.1 hypothetical protein [Paenibacillus sp. OAS669]
MLEEKLSNPDSIHAAVFVDGIRAALKEDPLFFVFKYHLSLIRDMTEGLDENITDELITESVAIMREACLDSLQCPKCRTAFRFRHCRNPCPSGKTIHVIELSCASCRDVFTLAEDRERVSYLRGTYYLTKSIVRRI